MNDSHMPVIQPPSYPQPHLHGPEGPGPETEQNPLLILHRLLRGRYILAGALAIVFGAIGLVSVYMTIELEYESVALVRVAPVLPRVLYETEQTTSLPMFDSFLQTQVALINSRRVIQMAMQSSEWRDVGGEEFTLEALEDFQSRLSAQTTGRGSQLIRIAFGHPEPRVARAAVKTVTDAYLSVYEETDLVSDMQRMRVLEDRERSLTNEIESLSSRILEIANEYGTSTLDTIYNLKVEELHEIGQELERTRVDLAVMESRLAGDAADLAVQQAAAVDFSVDEIALRDARMQRLLEEKRQTEWIIEDFEMTYRDPGQFPEYRRAQRRLETQALEVQQYANQFREHYKPSRTAPGYELAAPPPTEDSVLLMKQRVEQLEARLAEAQTETQTIGRRNVQIERLRAERSRAQEALNTTRFRVESLSLESTVGGRVNLLSEPETPSTPANHTRRIQMALVGGVAGGGLGIGLVMLLGLFNARVRDTTDAERVRPSLLGVLPKLPDRLVDPDETLIAAQCVHHIRTMLQSHITGRHESVISVTSAASGSGKTSLVLSLGLSFALSGNRTLLIDGDAVGRGLSRRTGAVAHQKIGALLCEYGIISRAESKRALEESQRTGERIGQVLLNHGCISESDLREVLGMQKELSYGLADALNGRPVQDCIADIGIDNLAILPAGDAAESLINGLSPDAVKPLLERLRGEYDMILIDTGPVPGTTDSSIMAAAADSVIMVVSRGDLNVNVHRTAQHLKRVNAPLIGLVMNRAKTRDIEKSGHSSSLSSDAGTRPVRVASKDPVSPPENEAYAAYGPLPLALLSLSTDAIRPNRGHTPRPLVQVSVDDE